MGSMGHGPQARVGMPVTPCWMELRAVGFVPACSSSLDCPFCLSQCVRLVSHSHLPCLAPPQWEGSSVCAQAEQFAFSFSLFIAARLGPPKWTGFVALPRVSQLCRVRMVLVTRCGWWSDWTVWWMESLSWELLLWWNPSFSISVASSFLKNTAVIFREKKHCINSSALVLEDYIAVIISNNGR